MRREDGDWTLTHCPFVYVVGMNRAIPCGTWCLLLDTTDPAPIPRCGGFGGAGGEHHREHHHHDEDEDGGHE